jgi:hypothetical protein
MTRKCKIHTNDTDRDLTILSPLHIVDHLYLQSVIVR